MGRRLCKICGLPVPSFPDVLRRSDLPPSPGVLYECLSDHEEDWRLRWWWIGRIRWPKCWAPTRRPLPPIGDPAPGMRWVLATGAVPRWAMAATGDCNPGVWEQVPLEQPASDST